MEFCEKLQELRKQKGLTQEELAAALYVSRTAISKWESGRGYPNIESLKAIAALFSVTLDDLLSGERLLSVAEEDNKRKQALLQDLVFGLLDLSVALFLFLPLFGQKTAAGLLTVSLLSLTTAAPYVRVAYLAAVAAAVALGIATLALQACPCALWHKSKRTASLALNAVGVLLFIVGSQPYAAALLFVFLVIKGLLTRFVSRR
ncbi:MAG: helix-turn-helix transcriptional regulator [Clostridia bacterium]|nr:helix-turn-helix transcriptional regulator [Clostridia bacterium]